MHLDRSSHLHVAEISVSVQWFCLQPFHLFTCPSGHLFCPTSALTCMLGSIRPSICNIFPHNALYRVRYATVLKRYSLRCTDAWILISHRRRTDIYSWADGESLQNGGNRIWKSCLLCTNLERCLITKISVHRKTVLKLTVFVYSVIFLYVSACVWPSSGRALRTAQCLRMALSNGSFPEDGSKAAGFRNFELY